MLMLLPPFDIDLVENWVQTSGAVSFSQRAALLELPVFARCRHVLALNPKPTS